MHYYDSCNCLIRASIWFRIGQTYYGDAIMKRCDSWWREKIVSFKNLSGFKFEREVSVDPYIPLVDRRFYMSCRRETVGWGDSTGISSMFPRRFILAFLSDFKWGDGDVYAEKIFFTMKFRQFDRGIPGGQKISVQAGFSSVLWVEHLCLRRAY